MRVPFVHLEGRAAATAAAGGAGFPRPAVPRVRVRALPLVLPEPRGHSLPAPVSSAQVKGYSFFLSCAPRALLPSLEHGPVVEFCNPELQNKNKPNE